MLLHRFDITYIFARRPESRQRGAACTVAGAHPRPRGERPAGQHTPRGWTSGAQF